MVGSNCPHDVEVAQTAIREYRDIWDLYVIFATGDDLIADFPIKFDTVSTALDEMTLEEVGPHMEILYLQNMNNDLIEMNALLAECTKDAASENLLYLLQQLKKQEEIVSNAYMRCARKGGKRSNWRALLVYAPLICLVAVRTLIPALAEIGFPRDEPFI